MHPIDASKRHRTTAVSAARAADWRAFIPDPSLPKWLWHFTSEEAYDSIRLFCRLWVYENRAFGGRLAISYTDIDPSRHSREEISISNWGEWLPEKMEAYVAVPFDAARAIHASRDHEWLSEYDLRLEPGCVVAVLREGRFVPDADIGAWCHGRRVRGEIPDRL